MIHDQVVGFGLVADVVLRSAAHTGASIVAKVPNGQRLKIFGTQGEYIEVDWCGTHGFVKMGNVVPVGEDIGGGPVADDNQHSPDRPAVPDVINVQPIEFYYDEQSIFDQLEPLASGKPRPVKLLDSDWLQM